MWPVYLAIHMVGLVGFNLMLRRSLRDKPDPWLMAAIMQTGVAVPMLVALAVAPPAWAEYSGREWMQLLVTAGLVLALQITNAKALESLEAGMYSVFFNLRIVFSTVLGIVFLGEDVVWVRIVGGALILAAVVVVRQEGDSHVTSRGIRWGIAAALTISALNLSEKDLVGRVGYLEYLIPAMLLASAVLWAVVLARGVRMPVRTLAQPSMLALMVFRAASTFGMVAAFATGAALSVATYVSSLSVIALMLVGVVALGERDHLWRKAISAAAAAGGLTLIFLAQL